MVQKVLPFLGLLLFVQCSPTTRTGEYLGQPLPDSIPEIFAPNSISVPQRLEHGLSFGPEGKQLAFGVLNEDGLTGTLYYTESTDNQWATPRVFGPLQEESAFLPYFTPDGKSMLFAKSGPDPSNGITDIWIIEKKNGNWQEPHMLPSPIKSTSREANASMTQSGTLYFSSNRNCEGKENCFTADLFASEFKNNRYESAQLITALTTPNDEESIFISPQEDYLIFCTYSGETTGMDLKISYRNTNGDWTLPTALDKTINTADWERRPFVSADNRFLFFTRLQFGEAGLDESDIYWVNTSKVFRPFVHHPISDITVPVGETFNISLPTDYFKDIDDGTLQIDLLPSGLEWLTFDAKAMTLSGIPPQAGTLTLTFSAVDPTGNRAEDTLKLQVTN